MAEARQTIAVFFGGRSVEHDVSVLTGLQFLEALDIDRFEGLPVYIDPEGQWWTGPALLKRRSYPLDGATKRELRAVTLPTGTPVGGPPVLLAPKKRMIGAAVEEIGFDLAVFALHGSNGEDGTIQGLFDFAGLPYAGGRMLGSALVMDKHLTKAMARSAGIKTLPHALIRRPATGRFLDPGALAAQLSDALGDGATAPLLVKPRHLGSSIGVSAAPDADAVMAGLVAAFRLDDSALVEPLVANLVEYNVAVRRDGDRVLTSAIERPERAGAVLDFQTKYLAGADGGPKLDAAPSEGMASLNRVLDPDELTAPQVAQIRDDAAALFELFDLAGTVRVDFLCDSATGDIWFNEVNPIPGSFSYFLWQAAEVPLGFAELASAIIDEGFALSAARGGATDAGSGRATIFARGD